MTIYCMAIYENGVLRPSTRLELPEGAEVAILLTPSPQPADSRPLSEVLAQIAALPMEGTVDGFSGRDHDDVLYPRKGPMP